MSDESTTTIDLEVPGEYYGLLRPLLRKIEPEKADSFRVIVTGPEDMLSAKAIEQFNEEISFSANGSTPSEEESDTEKSDDSDEKEPTAKLVKHEKDGDLDHDDAESHPSATAYNQERGDERPPRTDVPLPVRKGTQKFYTMALLFRCSGYLTKAEISHLLSGTKWSIPDGSIDTLLYTLYNEGALYRRESNKRHNPYEYQLTQMGRDAMRGYIEANHEMDLKIADNICQKQAKLLREM